MKVFVKKIVVFCILALIVLAIVVFVPTEIIRSKTSFKIKDNASMVIFGHSHSSYAYNDSLISNFQNLSDAGESYFYTYQKIKKIIPNNPQIKTVFIEFTNNQIDSKMDDWVWGYEKMSYFIPIYSPYMNKEEIELLYKKNSQDLFACLSIAAKKNLFKIVKGDFLITNSIDGYKWDNTNNLNKELAKSKSEQKDFIKNYQTSSINLEYLRKIIDLCHKHNKEVFLIRSPQHGDLPMLKNENYYQNIKTEKFKDVDLLDFNSFYVPNSHYIDLDHLNSKGAKSFSIFFDKLLKNNLLKSSNKEQLIKKVY